jgi:hypothetical protein
MTEIAPGVEFDTLAREWRCKWSPESSKSSLSALQKELRQVTRTLKELPGVKRVDRVVCGGCLDFKVITSLDQPAFGDWEKGGFEPEIDFLRRIKDIEGVTEVETQTFTIMEQ